ncbi:MAG: nuclear transport factor 2 family protein [Peptostreptococcaceae bacterium]|nr:nuclear transport factor 2 family protein [Peptostreptococcaceae bacterium]
MDIRKFWELVLMQAREELKSYFHPEAQIFWHNTNERFTVDEFILVNSVYPGEWSGEIERIERMDDLIITAVYVYSKDGEVSDHVVSFIRLEEGRIIRVDEYWGNDTKPPKWRLDMKIGEKIHSTKAE